MGIIKPVIIDNGSGMWKAGLRDDDIPKYCRPPLYASENWKPWIE